MVKVKPAPAESVIEKKPGLRVVGARMLVQRDEARDKSEGGILLPDQSKERPKRGVVLAVGRAVNADGSTRELTVDVGNHVVFSSYAGTEVSGVTLGRPDLHGLLFMGEDDVLAVVD